MTGTFRVNGVTAKQARNPFRASSYAVYDVFLAPKEGGAWVEIVSTTNPFAASVCERAHQTGGLVTIGARETRFGWEIVTVESGTVEAST